MLWKQIPIFFILIYDGIDVISLSISKVWP